MLLKVKGIMRNNSVIFFQLGPAVQEGMPLKDISYLELWQHLHSFEQNHLCNFGRRHHEEKLCEMVFEFEQWFRRCRLKVFLI